jgi:hypothetical protein
MSDVQTKMLIAQTVVLAITVLASYKSKSHEVVGKVGVSGVLILAVIALAATTTSQNLIDRLLIPTYFIWMLSHTRFLLKTDSFAYLAKGVYRDAKYFYLIATALLLGSLVFEPGRDVVNVFVPVSIVVAFLLLLSTLVAAYKFRYVRPKTESDRRPTVTLAIPARNEVHAIKANIEAALASNYNKIEILVLDDSSQDSTPQIIKSFAHDGVRFVEGQEPSRFWISKNQAYQSLLEQASGEIIIFCGVDVHLAADSVTQMVDQFMANKLKMMSIKPINSSSGFAAHVLQPLRHYWAMAIPRFIIGRPAAVSSLWMADRQSLLKAGGFVSVKNSVLPESHFAKIFTKQGAYGHYIADLQLGVTTRKRVSSQYETAIRLTYPVLRRSLALSTLALFAVGIFMVMPFVLAVLALFNGRDLIMLAPAIMLALSNIVVVSKISPTALPSAIITFPFSMIAQLAVIAISAWMYEFEQVNWKGRDISVTTLGYNVKTWR